MHPDTEALLRARREREERCRKLDEACDTTLQAFADVVMHSTATDVEKANILRAQREYSEALRQFLRAVLSPN